ncbi:MAG: tryptophan--tRNA ligase, partial [Bacteroidota bacterium]
LYDADVVPVGKDQKQHLEFTRVMAEAVNRTYGEDSLVVPASKIDESVMVIPGIDGQKMSKSRGNTIVIFQSKKKLRKQVMSIVTDSTPLEEPKNPDTCNVFALYKILATPEETAQMHQNYLGGNYGYGHAKTALFELIMERFANEREKYDYYMANLPELDQKLAEGAAKAKEIAHQTLKRVRGRMGY